MAQGRNVADEAEGSHWNEQSFQSLVEGVNRSLELTDYLKDLSKKAYDRDKMIEEMNEYTGRISNVLEHKHFLLSEAHGELQRVEEKVNTLSHKALAEEERREWFERRYEETVNELDETSAKLGECEDALHH